MSRAGNGEMNSDFPDDLGATGKQLEEFNGFEDYGYHNGSGEGSGRFSRPEMVLRLSG